MRVLTAARTVVVVGNESSGKSTLVGRLTGRVPAAANLRGSTVAVNRSHADGVDYVDTPGILAAGDSAAAALALAELDAGHDAVLLVVRATRSTTSWPSCSRSSPAAAAPSHDPPRPAGGRRGHAGGAGRAGRRSHDDGARRPRPRRPSAVLHTGRFDLDRAAQAAGWAQELSGEGHLPETEEYGIRSFTYRSRRPFHPQRLAEGLADDWDGLYPSKGFFWLATRPGVVGLWYQAGPVINLTPAGHWLAAQPAAALDELDDAERAEAEATWDPYYGDRSTELVFIGRHLDERAIRSGLDACLLTDAELSLGEEG